MSSSNNDNNTTINTIDDYYYSQIFQRIKFYQSINFVTIVYDHFQKIQNNDDDKIIYLHPSIEIDFQENCTTIQENLSTINNNNNNDNNNVNTNVSSCTAKKSILKIYHSPTNVLKNSYSISNLNIVILLYKKENSNHHHYNNDDNDIINKKEWLSLKFQYCVINDKDFIGGESDNSSGDKMKSVSIEKEKWFLTNENVRKYNEILEKESKWNKVILSPEIVEMKSIKNRDKIIVNMKIKQQSPLLSSSFVSSSTIK
ncbi:hypothetical protein Glove_335g66 [Diversispora epigaea]|uniref:Uncharacterized protein n=1 Tax=Diversispora epigaea TaxID=1348612 RepID=A0A397HHZ1_9GLOM|nr:hypothetical protein Glove_335g66 [Diversispora epigaea]